MPCPRLSIKDITQTLDFFPPFVAFLAQDAVLVQEHVTIGSSTKRNSSHSVCYLVWLLIPDCQILKSLC